MSELLLSDGSLRDAYRNFIAVSRYARWDEEKNRRETWSETVERYLQFMVAHLMVNHEYEPEPELVEEIRAAIVNHQVLPSMRSLMTAGPALERSHIAGYNCAYITLDHPHALDEALYVLMNGTGVGYSVESHYVSQLPAVPFIGGTDEVIHVGDSKEGWAYAFRAVLSALWNGRMPRWDLSAVRPAGARLKTFGGRASGPEPLQELFEFTTLLFLRAQGRQLRPIEVHDLMCKVAQVVVVGGVRRAAMISLSDLDDAEMREAKSGQWWATHPYRALANNSAVYAGKPCAGEFLAEWTSLYQSKSGERGLFNRTGAQEHIRRIGRRDGSHEFGLNPCAEILLRPQGFCNLTSVVVREDDDLAALAHKTRLASILGTWQSTLTDYPYLRPIWRENAEEERLLGVSMTGQLGHPYLNGSKGQSSLSGWLEYLRSQAVHSNAQMAKQLRIPRSAAVTTVKPEGTVSQLVGASSGMHPWHAKHYIRTVRGDKRDPLTQFLIEAGIPAEDELNNPDVVVVFSFPVKAPQDALTRHDLSAIEHLNLWMEYKRHWTEHNPSVTISVREDEWVEVASWVYANFDQICGVSFLPYSDHVYAQAPYQECTEQEYADLVKRMPSDIRWADLVFYETQDGTASAQTLACSAGGCDSADIAAAR